MVRVEIDHMSSDVISVFGHKFRLLRIQINHCPGVLHDQRYVPRMLQHTDSKALRR